MRLIFIILPLTTEKGKRDRKWRKEKEKGNGGRERRRTIEKKNLIRRNDGKGMIFSSVPRDSTPVGRSVGRLVPFLLF